MLWALADLSKAVADQAHFISIIVCSRHNSLSMNFTESLAGRMSQLSLREPKTTLESLINLHQDLITALQQADACARHGSSAGNILSEFQRITGCRRTEAQFYLKQSSNDIRLVSRCSYTCRDTALMPAAFAAAAAAAPATVAAQAVCYAGSSLIHFRVL
jgi:hypothetical protein